MAIAQSRVTAQGRISIPAAVRRQLGIGPGSLLEWAEGGNRMIVRRAGGFTSEDIHASIFGTEKPRRKSLKELKEGILRYARMRYARD